MLRDTALLYWMVKGHIPEFLRTAPVEELERINDSYFRRMWNNNEAYLHKEGFDEAWEEFNAEPD